MNLIYCLFPFGVLALWLVASKLYLMARGDNRHEVLRW